MFFFWLCRQQHGARFIYETDDDNYPENGLDTFQTSVDVTSHLVLDTENLTNNPYVHFGQSTLWPRGYPLDRIGLAADRQYNLCETRTPAVQQGVVNGDPDVDALFRMTRHRASSKLDLRFDRAAPPFMLPPKTYAPFNSQNTFFARRAFWALVLPTGVTDRATDIYRSYWVERLLQLVGESVAFAPPNALQRRNAHSDLADAGDEAELYRNMGRYVDVLNSWQCDATLFFDCVSQLSHHLVTEGMWKAQDAQVVDAWLSDLASIGYTPPVMMLALSPCTTVDTRPVTFYPHEQNTTSTDDDTLHVPPSSVTDELVHEMLSSACGNAHIALWRSAVKSGHKYPNTLLVISLDSEPTEVIPYLEAIYRPHYPNMLYCTREPVAEAFLRRWRVSVVRLREDVGVVPCLLAAADMRYGVRGFLHVTETMLLDSNRRITTKHDTLAWLTGEFDIFLPKSVAQCNVGLMHCAHITRDNVATFARQVVESVAFSDNEKTKLRGCFTKIERDPSWAATKDMMWTRDLAVYLPARLIRNMRHVRQLFLESTETVEFEFIAPLLMECDQLTVEYLQHSEDLAALSGSAAVDYLYPFSFRHVNVDATVTKHYCDYFTRFT